MDISAYPYFYGVLVDIGLLLVGGLVWSRQRRAVLAYALCWVLADAVHCFLVLASAGSDPAISRASVVWLVRGFVFIEHTILALAIRPFWRENTTQISASSATTPTQQAAIEEK